MHDRLCFNAYYFQRCSCQFCGNIANYVKNTSSHSIVVRKWSCAWRIILFKAWFYALIHSQLRFPPFRSHSSHIFFIQFCFLIRLPDVSSGRKIGRLLVNNMAKEGIAYVEGTMIDQLIQFDAHCDIVNTLQSI